MSDGLCIGGSSGLAFCLNTLLATHRSHPYVSNRTWLWERFFRGLRGASQTWAATGIVDADGGRRARSAKPEDPRVSREPQCHRRADAMASRGTAERDRESRATTRPVQPTSLNGGMVLGFASVQRKLRSHRCRHAAQSIMAVGDFSSRSQLTVNVLALAVSVVIALALGDIRNVTEPPLRRESYPRLAFALLSVGQSRHRTARRFQGRARVRDSGPIVAPTSSPMAVLTRRCGRQIRLTRHGQYTIDERDGTVWIERRRTFLTREFQAGERIASYPFAHITGSAP